MGFGHREQPKTSEEGIRPPFVIVQTSSLARSVLLFSQHRPQSTANEAVDRREREAVGLLEVGVPTLQRRIQRRNLRRHWGIARCVEPAEPTSGELMNITQAARELGIAASTIHRWLNDGFITGEQLTPGAPWRIRVNEALRRRLVQDVPDGYGKASRFLRYSAL